MYVQNQWHTAGLNMKPTSAVLLTIVASMTSAFNQQGVLRDDTEVFDPVSMKRNCHVIIIVFSSKNRIGLIYCYQNNQATVAQELESGWGVLQTVKVEIWG